MIVAITGGHQVHHTRKVVLAAMFDISVASEGGITGQVYDPSPTFSQYFHSFLHFIRITSLSPPITSYQPHSPKYVLHCYCITSIPLNTPLHGPSQLFTEWLGIDDVQATMIKGESLSNQPDNEYSPLLFVPSSLRTADD
jgi:hypothetical protein